MFQLSDAEVAGLRCQIGISNMDSDSSLLSQIAIAKNAEISLRSQSVTLKRGGRRTLPYAFTEQGVAMLSSVLRSPRSVVVNIAIMRTFVQLRRLMDSNALLAGVIFISAFQHLRISAFISRTRLSHPSVRDFRKKAGSEVRRLI